LLTKKIALAAGALTLSAGGVAAAAGSPPDEAEKGLATAEARVGTDLPATEDAHPGAPEAGAIDELEDEAKPSDTDAAPPVDTHGAAVSAVAQSDEHERREHGEAVSTVARSNVGEGASNGGGEVPEQAGPGQERAAEARSSSPAGRP
jgi:hypothetical protein